MVEPCYQFSNRHRKGFYLTLPQSSYKKLDLKNEITFFHPHSTSLMKVKHIRKDSPIPNSIPSEHGQRETEFDNTIIEPITQHLCSNKDEDMSSIAESSPASCLTQMQSTMASNSIANHINNQPLGTLAQVQRGLMAHQALCSGGSMVTHEVSSVVVSNDTLRTPSREDTSLQCGSLMTTSRAMWRRTTTGKR